MTETAIVVREEPGALLSAIVGMAKDASIDADKLGKLLEMQERLEERQARSAFNDALHRAQMNIPQVGKSGKIDLGAGKGEIPFAKWEDIDSVIRPILAREGLSLSFSSEQREGGGAVIIGELMHFSGVSKKASIPLPLDSGPGRNNLQAMGSTLSYGKRYVAEMLLNIVRKGEDTDGHLPQPITPIQVEKLRALIAETKSDEAKYLAAVRVERLEDITEREFPAALNLLEAKKAKAAKR